MGVMGLSFLGVIAALAMYAVSVSPSLMARSWAWHAVASGILVAGGYVAGVVVQNVGTLHHPRHRPDDPRIRTRRNWLPRDRSGSLCHLVDLRSHPVVSAGPHRMRRS